MVFCNSIDLGLVAKWFCASRRLRNIKGVLMTNLLSLLDLSGLLSASLLLALALLQQGLGDENVLLGRDGTVVKLRLVRSPPSYFEV